MFTFAHVEERVDVKGRPYWFLNDTNDSKVVSATIFPNPNTPSFTVYIWWQKTVLTEDGVSRRRWVSRYIYKNGFVSASKKRRQLGHAVMKIEEQVVIDALDQRHGDLDSPTFMHDNADLDWDGEF